MPNRVLATSLRSQPEPERSARGKEHKMSPIRPESWEERILQCWGPDDGEAELAELKKLWHTLPEPLPDACQRILWHVQQLSVCNWNLERQIDALCCSIGTGE